MKQKVKFVTPSKKALTDVEVEYAEDSHIVYSIWSEGYHAIGQRRGAIFYGRVVGTDFKDACINLAKTNKEFENLFSPEDMTFWGLKLYDNESDARKTFR